MEPCAVIENQLEVVDGHAHLLLGFCKNGDHANVSNMISSASYVFSPKCIALGYFLSCVKPFPNVSNVLSPLLLSNHQSIHVLVNMIIDRLEYRYSMEASTAIDVLAFYHIGQVFEDKNMFMNAIATMDTMYGVHKEFFHTQQFYDCLCNAITTGVGVSLFRNIISQMIMNNEMPEIILNNSTFVQHVCENALLPLMQLLHARELLKIDLAQAMEIVFRWLGHNINEDEPYYSDPVTLETFQWFESTCFNIERPEPIDNEYRLLVIHHRLFLYQCCESIITNDCEDHIHETILKYIVEIHIGIQSPMIRNLFLKAVQSLNVHYASILFAYNPNAKQLIVDAFPEENIHQSNALFEKIGKIEDYENWGWRQDGEEGLDIMYEKINVMLAWMSQQVNESSSQFDEEPFSLKYEYNLMKESATLELTYIPSIVCSLKMDETKYIVSKDDPPLEACMICYEHLNKCMTNCNHPLCKSCLINLFKHTRFSCPYCSTKIRTIHEVIVPEDDTAIMTL